MMKRVFPFLTAMLSICILYSCDEQSVTSETDVNQVEVDSNKTNILNVSGALFSVPSPIQTAMLIKQSGSAYELDSLHDISSIQYYVSKIQMALNMGVYGTDMAYASLYNDGQTSLKHFRNVEKLAEGLEIKGALDVDLIKRLGSNVGQADSLMLLSSQFYREADNYLKENARLDVAALVLTGGWVEATYLTTLAAKDGNQQAMTRLGEQKHTVKTIRELLQTNCDPAQIDPAIFDQLEALQQVFADLDNNYNYQAPEHFPEQKITRIKSTANYEITEVQFAQISEMVSQLRTSITQQS